jgi:predicted ArsR family transcriptional regulator
MTNQKISVNADHVLQIISQYPRPASLKDIADASGDAHIQGLEKHQVRHAVEEHLLEADLVDVFQKEVNGNEVNHYSLTETGNARVNNREGNDERVAELDEQVEEMQENIDEISDFINGKLNDKMSEFGEELDKTQEAVIERKVRIERIVEVLSDEFDREIGLHVYE